MVIYLESPGDPPVGISPEYAEIHNLRFDPEDEDWREQIRAILTDAFTEIWDIVGTRVIFEDELDSEMPAQF